MIIQLPNERQIKANEGQKKNIEKPSKPSKPSKVMKIENCPFFIHSSPY